MAGKQGENDTCVTRMSSMIDAKSSCGHLPVRKNLLHQTTNFKARAWITLWMIRGKLVQVVESSTVGLCHT
jgi:hypothetical protein